MLNFLDFLASVLTNALPIASVLVRFGACMVLLAHTQWVRLDWVGKTSLRWKEVLFFLMGIVVL